MALLFSAGSMHSSFCIHFFPWLIGFAGMEVAKNLARKMSYGTQRDLGFRAKAVIVDFACLNSLSSELHRDFIRAGQSARFTDFVSVGGLASAPGGVGMEAVVCRPHPHNPIAVDVDLA